MTDYDLIVICGIPRSGTTYIHDLFSGAWHRTEQYSNWMGGGFNTNGTSEPACIAKKFIDGDDPWAAIQSFVKEKRDELPNHTVVYKHPQLFSYPFNENEFPFKTFFIFCHREYDGWEKSALDHGISSLISYPFLFDWVKMIWTNSHDEPQHPDERLKTFHEMAIKRIIEANKEVKNGVLFSYDDPLTGIRRIIDGLGIDKDPKYIFENTWRPTRKG